MYLGSEVCLMGDRIPKRRKIIRSGTHIDGNLLRR